MIYELKATTRKKGEKYQREAQIPGIIYGPEVKENVMLLIKKHDLEKVYEAAGESSLINLTVEGEKILREVLIKDVAFDTLKDTLSHVDFYQIKRGQKLEIEAELVFIGEAPVVKESGGILVTNFDTITLRCLPKDIVSKIEVDLSGLKTFEDKIQVKDLKLPETVEILTDLGDTIVMVSEPEEEEEEKPAAAAAPVEGAAAEAPKAEEKNEAGKAEAPVKK